jgi:outer membrane receptor protein involved in Fe transport
MKTLLSAVVGATLALATIEASAQSSPGERQVSLTIETDTLASALDKWAQQSGFQIFVQDWEATKNLPARSLKGTFAAQDALEQLLSGTPLTYVWISDKAVSIRKKVPQTVPTALQRTGLEGQQSIPLAKFSGDDVSGGSHASTEDRGGGGTTSEPGPEFEPLEEVLVTGTYIRGGTPVGSPLKVYSRENVDRSGAATIEQFARTMTENFSSMDMTANSNSTATGFANTDASGAGAFSGAAFDLHGLGPNATLTLLNGNRVASAGFNGSITDISQVPLSAIERIEVLTDGSSAIYGADAIAGVVNIVTRTDFEGAETSVRYGGAGDGGATQLTASQLLGTAWDSGNVLFNYEYNQQDELDASDRDFIPDQGGRDSLMPENRVNSAFLAASQAIGSQTKLSGNAIYAERETSSHSHSENVFSISDSFNVSNVTQSGATLRLEHPVGDEWSVALAGNYSRVRQELVSNNSNTVDGDSVSKQEADGDLLGADLLVSGTLLQLATGPLKAAFGVSSREEDFENLTSTSSAGATQALALENLSRRVKSAYAELRLPVFGQPSSAQRMELSGAVRYDDYSDVGSTTNYKLGVGWGVIDGIRLRATYGTSFRAPLLTELGAATIYVAVPLPDPASPSGLTNTIIIQGGNPDLEPEESTSFTAGFDIQLAAIPHLSLGVTYFDIDFQERIASPPISGNPLTNPVASPFVDFSPPLAEVQSIFAVPGFLNFCCTGPDEIGAIFDPRLTNLAATRQSGIDFDATYEVPAASGQLAFTVSAARLLKNDFQLIESLPSIELLNTFARPPKWRGRGGVVWTRGGFNTSVMLNYVNSYENGLGASPGNPGSRQRIDSWTTADLFVGYTAGADASQGALRGLAVGFSVSNITDEQPPFVEIPTEILLDGEKVMPFDAANASALGRYFSLQITKQW